MNLRPACSRVRVPGDPALMAFSSPCSPLQMQQSKKLQRMEEEMTAVFNEKVKAQEEKLKRCVFPTFVVGVSEVLCSKTHSIIVSVS